jgi:ABC-type branched-subunit amino acid transport system ATPase component
MTAAQDGLLLSRLRVEREGRLLLDVDALLVPAGSCTAVVGSRDAGKTLLAAVVAGAVPSAGEQRLHGRTLSGPPSARRRAGLVAVANEPLRIRGVSVAEALALAARRGRHAADAFDRFPLLAARRGLRSERLSGGEHQALRIAAAWLAMPAALVLDSPTTGLAASLAEAVVQLAREEAERGSAVLWLDQPGAPTPAAPSLQLAAGRISALEGS